MSTGTFITQALTVVGGASPVGTTSNQSQLVLISTGFSGAAFTTSGTFAGTASFFATADGGANWFAINVAPSNSTTPVTSATAPGLWRANVSGYTHVCALLTALASGTPTVSICCSAESASALSAGGTSGGGGGPGITLTTTGTTGASTYNTGTGALNVPNYADISHLSLVTSRTSGASTLAAGVLNIPTYAPGTLNQVQVTTPSNYGYTSGSGIVSSGYGVAFQAAYSTSALITFSCSVSANGASAAMYVYVYRTTGSIPAGGVSVGTDVQVIVSRLWAPSTSNNQISAIGSIYDTPITVATPYNYYLGISSTTLGVTLYSGSLLQVTEAK